MQQIKNWLWYVPVKIYQDRIPDGFLLGPRVDPLRLEASEVLGTPSTVLST